MRPDPYFSVFFWPLRSRVSALTCINVILYSRSRIVSYRNVVYCVRKVCPFSRRGNWPRYDIFRDGFLVADSLTALSTCSRPNAEIALSCRLKCVDVIQAPWSRISSYRNVAYCIGKVCPSSPRGTWPGLDRPSDGFTLVDWTTPLSPLIAIEERREVAQTVSISIGSRKAASEGIGTW